MTIGTIIYEHTLPAFVIWVTLAAATAVALFSYWRFVKKDLPTVFLVVMRLVFFALLGWCLFLPGLRTVFSQLLKPHFIVAVDISNSMLLRPSDDVSNRWFRAMQVLDQPWTRIVEAECEVDVIGFASEVGEELSLSEAAALSPDGTSTLLRDALQRVGDRYAGLNVAGAVLLSDGIDTREAYDDWAAEERPFPFYTVLLEPKTAWEVTPDLRVDTVNTPRRVTVGWKSELKAVVSGQGTQGRPINVQLLKDGVLHHERPTQIPVGGGAREVLFELDHPETGVFTYEVRVPPLPTESNTNDNAYVVSVQVITARNHLLYVEGPPRWESKYLTRALRANRQMTPLVFLRGPGGKFMTFGTRGSMTPEMRESQLAFFKIVIVGNLDAEELGAERAQNLVAFVETGGSLILLGGSKAWGQRGFAETPLEKLLPVKEHARASVEGEFPVLLTDSGRSHPAFAGDASFWGQIPPVLSVFPNAALARGARALVTAQTPGGAQPLIVTHRYGQGKVAAIFTDSLWEWQLSPGAADTHPYRRFWDQLIAWMAPEEKEMEGREIELFADREELFLGETIELSARRGGAEEEAGSLVISCNIKEPDERTVPFAMSQGHVLSPSGKSFPGFSSTFTARQPGLHTALAVAELDGARVQSDPITFFVKPFTPESMPRPANADVLRIVAERSGGRYFEDIDALNRALSALTFSGSDEETAQYRSLWQHWLVLASLMAFLTIEWGIRKWQNMP